MKTVVIDNTVLSNFAHVKQPQLLGLAFDNSVTVPAAMNKLAEGVRLEHVPDVDWSWLLVIKLNPIALAILRPHDGSRSSHSHSIHNSFHRGDSHYSELPQLIHVQCVRNALLPVEHPCGGSHRHAKP